MNNSNNTIVKFIAYFILLALLFLFITTARASNILVIGRFIGLYFVGFVFTFLPPILVATALIYGIVKLIAHFFGSDKSE